MAFVRDLFERLCHPGVGPRGPATLSDAVSELWEREEELHRERERLEQAQREQSRTKISLTKREQPKPKAAPPDGGLVDEGEAAGRWVPRSF